MYVISWGACYTILCVVPYPGFLTLLDPNNTGSNSKTKVKSNIHAPIKKQKSMPKNSRRAKTNAIIIVVTI